jgi:hypothetical protein
MNNVLVLTDFSRYSRDAINYGVSLFYDIPSTFTLMNVAPPTSPNHKQRADKSDDINIAEKAFHKLLEEINRDFPSHKITFRSSFLKNPEGLSLKKFVEKEGIRIVIIGSKCLPELRKDPEMYYYSGFCECLNCNVLIVPENKMPVKPNKLIFAVDFKRQVPQNALNPLFYFARNLPSEIFLLQISSGQQSIEEAITGLKVIHSFENIPYSYHIANTAAVPKKITTFNKIHQSILAVLILDTLKLFESLADANYITQVLFQNQIPLLLIPQ